MTASADRLGHGNRSGIVAASGARTATASWDFDTDDARSLIVIIDVTADPASASVVFTISGINPATGTAYTILASAAITGTGTTVLRVSENIVATSNLIAQDIVPATVRVTATHADTDSLTYSIAAIVVP